MLPALPASTHPLSPQRKAGARARTRTTEKLERNEGGRRMTITVGREEISAGKLSPAHLQQGIEAIRREGYVVLGDIISHAHLDALRERMDEDSQKLIAAQKWGGAGQLPGHLQ